MAKNRDKLDAAAEMHVQRLIHAHGNPGFEGTYEFDVTIEVVGERITRRARAVYRHTPEWEYWDLKKSAPVPGVGSTRYSIELLAVPEEFHEDGSWTEGKPEWIATEDLIKDGVLPLEVRDEIIQGIDKQCRAEDERRRLAVSLGK